MNRYEIKDIASGIVTHGYEAEEPIAPQPEWGLLERDKPALQCSQEELDSAIDAYVVGEGFSTEEWKVLPQTYEVIVTNIDEVIAEREAKKSNKEKALERLKEADVDSAFKSLAVRAIIKDLIALLVD